MWQPGGLDVVYRHTEMKPAASDLILGSAVGLASVLLKVMLVSVSSWNFSELMGFL